MKSKAGKFIDDNFSKLLITISAIILILIAFGVVNNFSSILSALKNNKDSIGALQSISSIGVIVIGAIVSYYRFFRGRTFSTRLELEMEVTVIPADENTNIHSITLKARNIGTLSIWRLEPIITVDIHGPEEYPSVGDITRWYSALSSNDESETKHREVLDSGEVSTFFAQRMIPKAAWGVTYMGRVRSEKGVAWKVAKAIPNKET